MDEFLLELQARLDEAKSKGLINADIEKIQQQVDKLKLQAEIDPKSISNLVKQLENVLNQKITISNIGINQQQAIKNSQQVGQQIGNAINQGVSQGVSSASSATNKILRDFSELNDAKKKFVEGSDLITKEDIADANRFYETVKQAFSEFGQVTVNGKLTDGNLENLRVKIQQVNGELKTTREFMLYLNQSDKYENSFVLADDDTIKTTERLIQHLNEEKNIVNVTGDEIEKQKQQLADQEKYYKNLKNEVNNLYNLQTKLLSADELQTAELEKQIKQTKERISYNNKQLDKKVLTDNSFSREVTDLEVKRQKEFAIAVAKVRDGISENLTNLKSKWSEQGILVGEFKTKVEQLEASLSSIGSKGELDGLKGQIQALKAEVSNTAQANKIQLSLDTGEYESKVQNLIARTQQWTDENGNARISTNNLSQALAALNTAQNNLTKNNTVENQQALINAEKNLSTQIKTVTSDIRSMNAEFAKSSSISSLHNQVADFMSKNGKTVRYFGDDLKSVFNQTSQGAKLTNQELIALKQRFIDIQNQARQAGKLGKTFFQTIREGMSSFSYWTSSTFLVMKAINETRQAITTVKELDTALVDLKKTTDATAQELEDFYYSANDTAKQLGVTTEAVISATAAWSRLGYSIKDAQTMAENSAILTSISPDIKSIDESTDALVSVLKAYKIDAENSLDGVISKINIIGNTQAVSNGDIVDFLTRSSSAMAEANNTLEQTIALGTAATEITRDAAGIGQVLKTTSMRIRGYDEETESYSEDLEELSGKIADLTKTASTPGGISLFTDETKQTYKSTYDILKDISEIYDELSDKNQAELLEALAGKRNGQAIAAIISNFSAAEKSMDSMANSAGNAMKEMEVIYDSLDYKLNKLSETGTGVAQNLFARDDMKAVVDTLTSFMGLLDKLTEKLGLFGTIGLGAGLFAGFKNVGGCENAHSHCFELPTIICVL